MSAGIMAGIVVAVIVIAVVVSGVVAVLRRRRLRQRFGPEYDRVAGERGSRRKAEGRAGRARAPGRGSWHPAAHRFGAGTLGGAVDGHPGAVRRRAGRTLSAGAQLLAAAVMTGRGYPAGPEGDGEMTSPGERAIDHPMAAEDDKDTRGRMPDPAGPLPAENPLAPAACPRTYRPARGGDAIPVLL
jgi:hypothetical protein